MADEPENLTLKLLREMRAEMREGFEKAFGDIAAVRTEMREGFAELRGSVSELQIAVAAIRADQGRSNELLGKLADTQANQGARLNAIDGRLALIERHTGMVKA